MPLFEIKVTGTTYVMGKDKDDSEDIFHKTIKKEGFGPHTGIVVSSIKQIKKLSGVDKDWLEACPWGKGVTEDMTIKALFTPLALK